MFDRWLWQKKIIVAQWHFLVFRRGFMGMISKEQRTWQWLP
jgi:hypothetical protein